MTKTTKVLLVTGAIALVYGLFYGLSAGYSWMKGPEPGSRAWQIRQFRADSRSCSRFASRREDARKLLAWKPKPPWVNPPGTDAWKREYEQRREQESAELKEEMRNLNADLKALGERFAADELDCLRSLDWPDVQIESLRKEIREADDKRPPHPALR